MPDIEDPREATRAALRGVVALAGHNALQAELRADLHKGNTTLAMTLEKRLESLDAALKAYVDYVTAPTPAMAPLSPLAAEALTREAEASIALDKDEYAQTVALPGWTHTCFHPREEHGLHGCMNGWHYDETGVSVNREPGCPCEAKP